VQENTGGGTAHRLNASSALKKSLVHARSMPLRHLTAPAERVQLFTIARDDCRLLRAAPAFELPFPANGSLQRRVLFRVHESNRQSCGCVRRALPGLVNLETSRQIPRGTDIKTAVAAFKDISPPNKSGGHLTRPVSKLPFDSLRSLRTFDSRQRLIESA
jgi:hypothetical protein